MLVLYVHTLCFLIITLTITPLAVLQELPQIVSLTFVRTSVDDPAPTFILTCTSTNRPPTYITWTRDGTQLSNDNIHSLSQSLINRELATYVNTLTVTGRLPGQYRCHVTTEGWESQQNFTQSARKNITVMGQCNVWVIMPSMNITSVWSICTMFIYYNVYSTSSSNSHFCLLLYVILMQLLMLPPD